MPAVSPFISAVLKRVSAESIARCTDATSFAVPACCTELSAGVAAGFCAQLAVTTKDATTRMAGFIRRSGFEGVLIMETLTRPARAAGTRLLRDDTRETEADAR